MACDEDLLSNLQEQKDEVLALQSIFNTDDIERLKLLCEITDNMTESISFLMSVSVKPVGENLSVCIMLPKDVEEMEGAAAAAIAPNAPNLPKNVQLNRSLSGARWTGLFEVKFLSPIMMYITFPNMYPSSEPPSFNFVCGWLSAQQIESLSTKLMQLWEEGCSMPIVFTWIDWLENSALDHLGISDQLTLQFLDHLPIKNESDEEEMYCLQDEIGEIIATIIQYNREQMDIEFCQNIHECEVCCDEKQGTQFFRLQDCNHKFCHGCMQTYCQFHVNQGTVEELRCPDTKCKNVLPPYIVQAVLDPVAFGKWEKLLLQKTLDAMSDTVYCPRCQSLVITEEENLNLAHCTVCLFSFCTLCNMSWHQGTNCTTEEELMQRMTDNIKRPHAKMSPAEQKKLDEMLRRLQQFQDEANSKLAMKRNFKTCPKCRVQVEKIGGCNKMTCRCSHVFCWICGKSIEGYSHFRQSNCALFPGQDPGPVRIPVRQPPRALLEMRARIAVNPELENKQGRCPGCKQLNLKDGSNNHIKCWNCKSNFCFMCKQKIMTKNIANHFRGPCVQHS